MINYKSCAQTVGALTHVCDPCDTPEMGRVRSIVLIKSGTVIELPLSKTEWQAAIEAGNIIIIPEVIGSFDGGTPVYGEGYGNKKEKKLYDDYVLPFRDPNYADNEDFWQEAEQVEWNAGYCTETLFHYINAPVSLAAKAPVEEGLDTRVVWNVELKWSSKKKPQATPIEPVAEFFKCFEVTDTQAPANGVQQ